jgi:hypothetical protein
VIHEMSFSPRVSDIPGYLAEAARYAGGGFPPVPP